MENSMLTHHGILGQKWGVRRYQNKDGTLTNAGKKRYGIETVEKVAAVVKSNSPVIKDGYQKGPARQEEWMKRGGINPNHELKKPAGTIQNLVSTQKHKTPVGTIVDGYHKPTKAEERLDVLSTKHTKDRINRLLRNSERERLSKQKERIESGKEFLKTHPNLFMAVNKGTGNIEFVSKNKANRKVDKDYSNGYDIYYD